MINKESPEDITRLSQSIAKLDDGYVCVYVSDLHDTNSNSMWKVFGYWLYYKSAIGDPDQRTISMLI